jgi:hypothetical protein
MEPTTTTTTMKLSLITPLTCAAIVVTTLLLVACSADDPGTLRAHNGSGDPNAADAADGTGVVASALQCTDKPDGRSYTLFDGSKMEATRVNENIGVNRARLKPYAVMATEYQRVLGLIPDGIKTSGGSFDDPPARWFSEAEYSGVSMNAIFEISFQGCLAYTRASATLTALPTPASAADECTQLIRKAWSRSPSPDEIAGCTDLAVTKLTAQTDVPKRWAYVCASILSSSQFLTY